MRSRPHVLSTRLDPAGVEAYRRSLQAPKGGWFVPAHYARWALLQADAGPVGAIHVDVGNVEAALARFRVQGRILNMMAFTMNSSRDANPNFSILEESWPTIAGDLLTLAQPRSAAIPCPVPVHASAPAVARPAAPLFRQKGRQKIEWLDVVVATRLDDSERAFVTAASHRAGLDIADFFRVRLLQCDPLMRGRLRRPVARVLAAVLEECGRQANNLRQLERAHERRGLSVPTFLSVAMGTLWEIRDSVIPTLRRWRP